MAQSELFSTAYLVAWGRSQNVGLSQDKFAHLWLNANGISFAESVAKDVCRELSFFHCLRHRYVFEKLRAFEAKQKPMTLFNLGSGITSYPFLLKDNGKYCEIDQHTVIEYRRKIVEALQSQERLPKRNVEFYSLDLNSESSLAALELLLIQETSPFFLLLEGILPYLTEEMGRRLLQTISDGY